MAITRIPDVCAFGINNCWSDYLAPDREEAYCQVSNNLAASPNHCELAWQTNQRSKKKPADGVTGDGDGGRFRDGGAHDTLDGGLALGAWALLRPWSQGNQRRRDLVAYSHHCWRDHRRPSSGRGVAEGDVTEEKVNTQQAYKCFYSEGRPKKLQRVQSPVQEQELSGQKTTTGAGKIYPLHEKYELVEVVTGTSTDKKKYYVIKANRLPRSEDEINVDLPAYFIHFKQDDPRPDVFLSRD